MIPRPRTATMKLSRQLSSLPLASSIRVINTRRLADHRPLHLPQHPRTLLLLRPATSIRHIANTTSPSPSPSPTSTHAHAHADADAVMEHLTDLYNTARDEFEIAAEETEKKTTYGPEDREAAHEAFQALKEAYGRVVVQGEGEGGGDVGKEVERRVGPRIRELEAALKGMDEMALED